MAGEARYRWDVLVELDVPAGSSAEDVRHLTQSVQEMATEMHRYGQTCNDCSNPSDHDGHVVGYIVLGLAGVVGIAVLVGVTIDGLSKHGINFGPH